MHKFGHDLNILFTQPDLITIPSTLHVSPDTHTHTITLFDQKFPTDNNELILEPRAKLGVLGASCKFINTNI